MISCAPFRVILRPSGASTYTLIKNHRISGSTINNPVNTTVNDLCRILNCRLEQILEYIPSEEDQTL